MRTNQRALGPSCWAALVGLVLLAACDPSTLPSCTDGKESCLCTPGVAGQCNAGLLCDEAVGLCREPLTCEQAACSAHQQCAPATATTDSACLEACEFGYRWNVVGQRCDRVDATCTPQLEASCAAKYRACTVPSLGGDPYCGSCLDGYVDENNTCRPAIGCATIIDECTAKNRQCQDAWFGPNEDARCGPCPQGTALDDTGTCRCTVALKKWDPAAGACVDVVNCTALNCAASGDVCVGAIGDQDAYCDEGCPVGTLWSALNESCLPCAACEKYPGADLTLGSNGRLLNGTQDMCLCATKPGHFFSFAGQVGVFACDNDGDGWVRESARASMYASEPLPAGVDRYQALRDQARCTVRRIDRWVLQNDHGNARVIPQSPPVLMFESDRNDDDKLLEQEMAVTHLDKAFGGGAGTAKPGAGLPLARQLNRLTRYCHLPGSDFNDNGAADISEWPDAPPAKAPAASVKVFNQFSYFAELHVWDFGKWSGSKLTSQPRTQTATQPTEQSVDYWIGEVARTAPGFPISYGGQDATWKQCTRKVDTRRDLVELPAGIDFGATDQAPQWPTWRGMTHSSQFKCLQVSAVADPEDTSKVATGAELSQWVFNRCTAATPSGDFAPLCTVQPADQLGVGHVRWGAARFEPYHDTFLNNGVRTRVPTDVEYRFGCVDECAEIQESLETIGAWGSQVSGLGFTEHATQGSAICAVNPNVAFAVDFSCELQGNFGRLKSCAEVCNDGWEGDGSPATPDAIPGGACSTGLAGACSTGSRTCSKGLDRCMALLSADPTKKDHCNGTDDDCDGVVDEDGKDGTPGAQIWSGSNFVPAATACSVPGGFGACVAGQWKCNPAGKGAECRPNIAPGSLPELCDGADNNCNGQIDDAPKDTQIGQSCTVTDPAELAKIGASVIPGSACTQGQYRCLGGVIKCAATQPAAGEVCNALDDDCDGQIDEGDVCVCDLLTQDLWFHGEREDFYKGTTGDGETGFQPLRHEVTVTPGLWQAANPTKLPIRLKLVVTELKSDSDPNPGGNSIFAWERVAIEDITKTGDPMPQAEWYLTYEHPSVHEVVRWLAGPGFVSSFRDCKALYQSLPKGVSNVGPANLGASFSTSYRMQGPKGHPAFPHWTHSLERRVFDLYGWTQASTVPAVAPVTRTLPGKIPNWSGLGLPQKYAVSWAVDRFELMKFLDRDCDARCEYFKAYPTHPYLTSSGGNCTGGSEWCDWKVNGSNLGPGTTWGILGVDPPNTGGRLSGHNPTTGFDIVWEAPLDPGVGEFRRIRTAPGWGNGASDERGTFFQTWLRFPIKLTPVK